MKTHSTFLLNLFVALLFVLINPLYAISICAVLNFMNNRINFLLFSIMFASSFGLFYFLRNWSFGYDAIAFLKSYQVADSHSFTDIFYRFVQNPSGNEPLWTIYLWLSRNIIGNHVDFFAFFHLFIMFLLTAYLGKVVDQKRFVVVIACILFVSTGFLSTFYEIWRHIFALLLFFIGIFLLEADRHRRLARGLMYSSALFHVVAIPLVAVYEFFTLCNKINARSQRNKRFQTIQRYSIQIVAYAILASVMFKWAEGVGTGIFPLQFSAYQGYQRNIGVEESGYAFLFNPLTAALIVYFWFNRKQISKNDVFIGINYFLLIGASITIDIASIAIGRAFYFFLVGASILCGKLVLKDVKLGVFLSDTIRIKDVKLGFLYLVTIILFMFYSYIKHGGGNLSMLVGENFLNPAYGLVGMILNYGEFLVPPSAVL